MRLSTTYSVDVGKIRNSEVPDEHIKKPITANQIGRARLPSAARRSWLMETPVSPQWSAGGKRVLLPYNCKVIAVFLWYIMAHIYRNAFNKEDTWRPTTFTIGQLGTWQWTWKRTTEKKSQWGPWCMVKCSCGLLCLCELLVGLHCCHTYCACIKLILSPGAYWRPMALSKSITKQNFCQMRHHPRSHG